MATGQSPLRRKGHFLRTLQATVRGLQAKKRAQPHLLPCTSVNTQPTECLGGAGISHVIKDPPANAGDIRDVGSIPGKEDPPEKEMATHSNIFAWEITRTEEPGGLWSTGSQRVNTTEATQHTQRK